MQVVSAAALGEAAERVLIMQNAPAPPAGTVYPMPYYDAPRALACLLTNPLLLAWQPGRMAATAAAYAAGRYDANKVRSVACYLLSQRDRINSQTRCEPEDRAAERELLDLCESTYLRAERAGLRRRVMLARPSEYPWLRGLLEAAITSRAEAALELLHAA